MIDKTSEIKPLTPKKFSLVGNHLSEQLAFYAYRHKLAEGNNFQERKNG